MSDGRVEPPAEHRGVRWHWIGRYRSDAWPSEWWSEGGGKWNDRYYGMITPEQMGQMDCEWFAPCIPPGPSDGE